MTDDTPSGARVNLRLQHGGIVGAGTSILPLPPLHLSMAYDIFAECDTSRLYLQVPMLDLLG